ncbi:MAG: glutamate--tRNA ligase [Alphaproteobacteria bacterium]|nr:glutamate--tRNA ligase [Alphaproteobacteria bacterium]
MIPRCRFAPSPTGRLHVGGARSALFNLLFARNVGGRMILRIEDTDQVRSSRRAEDAILDDLRWVGVGWDEGPDVGGPGAPYRQSERRPLYDEALHTLLERGHAYHAWETPEELDALREEAKAAKENFRYRKVAYSDADLARFEAEGRIPTVRLAIPPGDVSFVDRILGEVTVRYEDLEDFVIVKADGFPTYHFAVVVDDHHMKVTHVLRAQEHLLNTTKHLVLYGLLGWDVPEHGHMPLIFSMGGGKMSKRDKAKAARQDALERGADPEALASSTGLPLARIEAFLNRDNDEVEIAEAIADALGVELPEIDVVDFRRAGYLPEALLNFLALLGWSAGDDREIYTLDELIAAFSLDRVGTTAARFDHEKLKWMNGQYIRDASVGRLVTLARGWAAEFGGPLAGVDDAFLRALVALHQPRVQTLRELSEAARVYLERPTAWGPEKTIQKHLLKGQVPGLEALRRARPALAALDRWSDAAIEYAVEALAEADFGGKMGKVAQPLRIAATGGPVSPPIGGTLALVGKAETLARIDACLAHFEGA